MLAVFAFGLLYSAVAPPADAAGFFASYAIVSLLSVLVALELHTYTSREIVAGLGIREALLGNLRLQATFFALGVAVAGGLTAVLGLDLLEVALTMALVLASMAVQEAFRVFVALGFQGRANALMIGRGTVPFGLLTAYVLLSPVPLAIEAILLVWLSATVVTLAVALLQIAALDKEMDRRNNYHIVDAVRVARHYLPVAAIARAMLSLDIIIVATFGQPEVAVVLGNVSNLAAAFFTLADLAIVQWRLHRYLKTAGISDGSGHLRDSTVIASVSSVAIMFVGVLAFAGALGPAFEGTNILAVITCIALASAFAIIAQSAQMPLYAASRDWRILSAYLWGGGAYLGLLLLASIFGAPELTTLGRALGFGIVACLLSRSLSREGL